MTKRYLGNIITQNPTAPAGPYQDSAASGVWSLAEAFAYNKAGLWPTKGNIAEYVYGYGNASAARGRTLLTSLGDQVEYGTFGDASENYDGGGCSSDTRGIAGGARSGNTILYFTLASAGGTTDFGDRTVTGAARSASNNTRGLFFDQGTNVIDYITIASAGNATDFGDRFETAINAQGAASGSSTRALNAGGWVTDVSLTSYTIQYVTIASTGNALDFGDLTVRQAFNASAASGTRALFAGGISNTSPTAYVNVINYVTIASTGNATDFGDLVYSQGVANGEAGTTRALFMGSDRGTGGYTTSGMYYVTTASTGNAAFFGDLTVNAGPQRGASCCNATVAVQP